MRAYKRKLNTRRGRGLRAAEMRAAGLSLREIAKQCGCSYETVRRDLLAMAAVVTFPVTKVTPGGEECDGECDSSAVVSLSAERFVRRPR